MKIKCTKKPCADPVCSQLYTDQKEYEILDHIFVQGFDCYSIINDQGCVDIVTPHHNLTDCPKWELVKCQN